jgi:glutamyl-tRNA synthetase
MIRTRFAPSPTGFLHIGGARTALFSWAFARRHEGVFILRIEDTDVARSTPEAVQAILDGMKWLGLEHDEGPFYQMQRMDRYREVVQQMIAAGTAYYCYMPAEELDALREAQRARGEKPRYDGRWRPEAGKTLPPPPAGVKPVVRFKNPASGSVTWNDAVKGKIEFSNEELDDLIIARPDGTPTYNFCVVVDDWDMGITHVIRGDDHVNNTPRQINILQALGATIPTYAHLSMILGDDGQKLSKRHGAVSVMQYDEEGYLPEAVINYLARLGWSHGDDEVFNREQLVQWFDLDHITASAAQFNTEKLLWLNQHYMKHADPERLAGETRKRFATRGVDCSAGPNLLAAVRLYQDRCNTLNLLADSLEVFYVPITPHDEVVKQHTPPTVIPALRDFAHELGSTDGSKESVSALIKNVIGRHGIKMPQLAMPLRVALTGQAQAPSVDALVALCGAELTQQRVLSMLERVPA